MLDPTPTQDATDSTTEPVVVLVLNRSCIRRWTALGIIALAVAVVAPSPLSALPAHEPVCQLTTFC